MEEAIERPAGPPADAYSAPSTSGLTDELSRRLSFRDQVRRSRRAAFCRRHRGWPRPRSIARWGGR
jgi:hypothetical protein